jgi:hypothetical protein
VRIEQLDTKKGELAIGAAFVLIAAIVVAEATRLGAGWGPSGPQPGFFPRIAALAMALTSAVTMIRAGRRTGHRPLFASASQCREVLKVGGPMAAAVCALSFIGFYAMAALYMGLFSLWYGRYRWYVALGIALVVPIVFFLTFERGFKILLPKSLWYASGLPF